MCKMKGVTREVPRENYYTDLQFPSARVRFIVTVS